MRAMPMMHEQMHQWTGEQQQEWQRAKQMGTVLGKQIKSGNYQKCKQNPVTPRGAQCEPCPVCSSCFITLSFQKKIYIIQSRTSQAKKIIGSSLRCLGSSKS